MTAEWSRGEFARIARDVEARAGILFPINRIASAEAGMKRVMSKLQIADPVSLELAVGHPGPVRDALMAELTIGESYFFREPAQLRFLADELFPEWNSTWASGRGARIWSAGCAGGQEPYSIAILMHERGWSRSRRILGTDISDARLDGARDAVFSQWSLRSMQEDRAKRWFRRAGSKYTLDRQVAREVEFTELNLAVPFAGIRDQDAIFCRNVLIYFSIPTITAIAERLLAALGPDGWLFLGASDPHIADLTPCEAVVLPGTTAYRRCSDAVSGYSLRNAPLTLIRPAEEDRSAIDPLTEAHDDPGARPEAVPVPTAVSSGAERADTLRPELGDSADSAESRVQHVRRLANEGLLAQAGIALAAALEAFPQHAELHLMESILHAQADRWDDAARAARRALYLDRSLILAYVALGDALGQRGNSRGARLNFENAAAQITRAEQRGELADREGVPLARLMHIVRAHLSALGVSAESGADSARRIS